MAATIEIQPLSAAELPLLWQYLREFPRDNFDDFGPATLEDFEQMMAGRLAHEIIVGFRVEGEFIGAAAYSRFSPRSGALHGVAFARKVHGSGIPREAMRGFLRSLRVYGAEKISAQIHADNIRAWRFFKKLGFVQEGYFRAHTLRAGRPIDLRIIALFPGASEEN
jgi:RimJ/RimL family protein N-acetyltransferase